MVLYINDCVNDPYFDNKRKEVIYMAKKAKVTEAQVKRKMKKLKIVGWDSLGKFTLAEHMEHLEEIERRQGRRKKEI